MQVLVTNLVSILEAQCVILGGQVTGVDSGATERQQTAYSAYTDTPARGSQQEVRHIRTVIAKDILSDKKK